MKISIMKRLCVAAILCFAVIAACACSTPTVESPDSDSATEAQPQEDNTAVAESNQPKSPQSSREDYFSQLEQEDFGGVEFVIATTDPSYCDPSRATGAVAAELSERYSAIEKKLNIKITVAYKEPDILRRGLAASDEDSSVCDLLYLPMDTISSLAESNMLMNVYSIPYFDFDAPYAEQEFTRITAQNETAYGIYGDTAFDDRFSWCIFYNKYFTNALGYDVERLVAEGKWTWDKLLEISQAATADIDQNGAMTREDRFGYASTLHTTDFARAVFASFGKTFLSYDDEGWLKPDFATTEQDSYIEKIKEICVSSKSLYPQRNPRGAAFTAFTEGRVVFFAEQLSFAKNLSYLPIAWEIAPMPKLDEEQQYTTLIDPTVCGFAIPYHISNPTLTGKVLNALYAYDYSYGKDFLKTAYIHYYLPSNASAAALSHMSKNSVYDPAYALAAKPRVSSLFNVLSSYLERGSSFSRQYDNATRNFEAFIKSEFSN